MKVNEFLKIVTKDNETAEYTQKVVIKTYIPKGKEIDSRTLAEGSANELIKINDIENVVCYLQEFTIVEVKRIPQDNLPLYNCPYLLTVR